MAIALAAVFSTILTDSKNGFGDVPLSVRGQVTAPQQISVVTIPKGASNPAAQLNYEPRTIRVVIGINNTVEWINQDSVAHSMTSDTNYVDPVSGPFNSFDPAHLSETGNGFLNPSKTFNFTFTEPGTYGYHGEPHPWMRGMVIVVPLQ
jgi:plastocyanin